MCDGEVIARILNIIHNGKKPHTLIADWFSAMAVRTLNVRDWKAHLAIACCLLNEWLVSQGQTPSSEPPLEAAYAAVPKREQKHAISLINLFRERTTCNVVKMLAEAVETYRAVIQSPHHLSADGLTVKPASRPRLRECGSGAP